MNLFVLLWSEKKRLECKPDKRCIGPPGLCSTCSWVMKIVKGFCRVTDLATMNASRPDKHWLDPAGPVSACSWVNASMNLDIDVKHLTIALHRPSGPMHCLELGYESGHGERKQAWQALHRPSGPMQCLQKGYASGRWVNASWPRWTQARLDFGSSQCLQLGERKHESG